MRLTLYHILFALYCIKRHSKSTRHKPAMPILYGMVLLQNLPKLWGFITSARTVVKVTGNAFPPFQFSVLSSPTCGVATPKKINKTGASSCQILRLKCSKFSLSLPQTLLERGRGFQCSSKGPWLYLKVHGHGQTHSHNFCRLKLDIYFCIYNMSIWAS